MHLGVLYLIVASIVRMRREMPNMNCPWIMGPTTWTTIYFVSCKIDACIGTIDQCSSLREFDILLGWQMYCRSSSRWEFIVETWCLLLAIVKKMTPRASYMSTWPKETCVGVFPQYEDRANFDMSTGWVYLGLGHHHFGSSVLTSSLARSSLAQL